MRSIAGCCTRLEGVGFPAKANMAGNLAGTSVVFMRARRGIATALPSLSVNGKAAFFLDLLFAFRAGL